MGGSGLYDPDEGDTLKSIAVSLRRTIQAARKDMAVSCSCDRERGKDCGQHETIRALYFIETAVVEAVKALEDQIRELRRTH